MDYTVLIGIVLWALIPGFLAKKKGRSFWRYYFLSLVITPLLTTIIILCLRSVKFDAISEEYTRRIKKIGSVNNQLERPKENEHTCQFTDNKQISSPDEKQIAEQINSMPKIQYCRRCGYKLIDDSDFCSNCGLKIRDNDKVGENGNDQPSESVLEQTNHKVDNQVDAILASRV